MIKLILFLMLIYLLIGVVVLAFLTYDGLFDELHCEALVELATMACQFVLVIVLAWPWVLHRIKVIREENRRK